MADEDVMGAGGADTAGAGDQQQGGGTGDQSQGGEQTPHWSAELPEQYRDSVQGFESWDKVKEALAGPVVPEKYAVPENVTIDNEVFASFAQMARELKLPQSTVDALIKFDAQRSEAMPGKIRAQVDAQYKAGLATMAKELGNERYQMTVKQANDALRKYGDAETIQYLKDTGLANSPTLVKLLARVGARIQEDTPRSAEGSSTGTVTDPAKILYPNYK